MEVMLGLQEEDKLLGWIQKDLTMSWISYNLDYFGFTSSYNCMYPIKCANAFYLVVFCVWNAIQP